ncbi:hypothetical protein [Mangrovibacillus cuniculi]|uniref:Uncharacterized protein n=1 Tax=Mangrovibacillus cuniculi TaxID=2593652 RepID=A0A7S8C975_9BACI|nr:hypothetical protein [Mangrovibacillus cuniculi]QPC45745.1 hypothetical protein G8O30_01545 [Mangrovibacillus cuniculi]
MNNAEIRSLFTDYDLEETYSSMLTSLEQSRLLYGADVECMEDFLATYNYQILHLSYEEFERLYTQFVAIYPHIKNRYDFG